MKIPDNFAGSLGRKSAKGASSGGFQDIKINMFREGFAERPRQIGWIFLTILAVLAIAGVVPVSQLYLDSLDDSKVIEAAIAEIQADIDQYSEELIAKEIKDANANIAAMHLVVPEKELLIPLVELFSKGLPYAPNITKYKFGASEIALEGTSESPYTIIEYSRAIEALDGFDDVHPSWSETVEGGKAEFISEMVSSAIEMTETIETSTEGTIDDGPIVINPDIISKSGDDDEAEEEAEGVGVTGSVTVGTDPVVVLDPPIYLTPKEQEPVRVLLEATATSYDPIVLWEWDFGDGTTKKGSDVPRVFHDYTHEGDYSVSVTVYDAKGRKGMSIMAGMFEKPHADFAAGFVKCDDPLTVKFTDLSSSMGMLLSWEWDFNADEIVDSTDTNPTYTFPEPGYYNVTLTVEGTLGQPDSKTWPVLASAPPTSDFMASPIIIGSQLKVDFTDLSTTLGTNDEQLALWQWNFGDGTTSTEQHPTHTYNGMGPYTVSLTVTESDGNCATRTRTINKANVPDASFTVTPTGPLAIQFSNTSASGNEETSWLWSFGDGFVSNEKNPVHTYDESGEYAVSVSIIEHISDPLDPNTMTYVITSASADIEVSDATSTPFTLTIEKSS